MIELRNEIYTGHDGDGVKERPTKLVAAAILHDGRIWTGNRHASLVQQIHEDTGIRVLQGEQGFLTDTGLFVSRKAGLSVAIRYKQVSEDFKKSYLLSEDLW